jgi:hypothetical protein
VAVITEAVVLVKVPVKLLTPDPLVPPVRVAGMPEVFQL